MNLRNRLKQIATDIKIIEMYNYYYILGAEKDIIILKEKLEYLQHASASEIQKELKTFCELVNSYFKIIPVEFIKEHHEYLKSMERDMLD